MSKKDALNRIALVLAGLLILAPGWGVGPALAGHDFVSDYGGVFLGITNASGPEQHFSYYANYFVDGVSAISGGGYKSVHGGAAPPVPFSILTDYRKYLRERVLLGTSLAFPNRRHGRLGFQNNYGLFTSFWDNDEWHLGVIAYRGTVGELDDGDLADDYWSVRVQFSSPDGGTDAHLSAFGTETYDGVGGFTGNYTQNLEGGAHSLPVAGGHAYSLASDGTLTRFSDETGYWLNGGAMLATAKVSQDDEWGITLSVKKPDAGTSGLASLQGPYWLTAYKYFTGTTTSHLVAMGEAYFDGAGNVFSQIHSHHSSGFFYHSSSSHSYTVSSSGDFSWNGYMGGVGQGNNVIIAAQPHSAAEYGFMVMIRRYGIEDPSPMCQLLGLAP